VLNKFAIVPEHFILATKAFKPQTHLLEPEDLAATYACIQTYAHDPAAGELFAFFNSGEHSGASQAHRHIQLLPIASMESGIKAEDEGKWKVLVDDLAGAPFATFSASIHPRMSPDELHAVYMSLYRKGCAAIAASTNSTLPEVDPAGQTTFSYNLGFTKNTLALLPRVTEGAAITTPEGRDVGKLALNGTVLAGTALVKNEAEWDTLRANPEMVSNLLKAIGLPNTSTASPKI